jgi:hypothetical protein
MPVPDSATVKGLLGAFVVMVSTPAGWAPAVEGVRVTPIVQLAPAANVGFKHVDDGLIAYGVPDVTARDETERELAW